MLDISRIKDDPAKVSASLEKRGAHVDFAKLLEWDTERREIITKAEAIKAERNRVNQQIPRIKKEGGDVSDLIQKQKAMQEEVGVLDGQLKIIEQSIKEFMDGLPNIPDDDLLPGGKENNKVIKTYVEKPVFDFTPKNHIELCADLKLIDYERGVKMSGNGFWIYTGLGAQIEWALLSYFISEHIKSGYTFMLPPHMLGEMCGYAAGQFPKFKDEVYALQDENGQFMLPTAETALVNYYRDEILSEDLLPQRLFAYTPCYRKEAGSYRASERGMIRGHQFNKVEMFAYTKPEESDSVFEELVQKACSLVEGLELHYQLSKLAAGDCSASMARTYDIELWIPSMDEYKECSSVSNARDYQARRGNMRYRNTKTKRTEFVHTLNGSGLATSRLLPAILEQHQRKDGSVYIPGVLRPFLGNREFIGPSK
jgi:seryl-tRNA synthetase